MQYRDFLLRKLQHGAATGFPAVFMPDSLFDFQKSLTEWAVSMGRSALANGRRAIGIELKPSYFSQAVKNVEAADTVTTQPEEISIFQGDR